jgi:hypothetical protein
MASTIDVFVSTQTVMTTDGTGGLHTLLVPHTSTESTEEIPLSLLTAYTSS